MSFKTVTRLRKSGQLKKALDMAIDDLQKMPHGKWEKRAIAWVYYAYLKQAQEKNNIKKLLVQIENIKKLDLPGTESMVFDSIAWCVGKYLLAENKVDTGVLNSLFTAIETLHFSKPADAYSYMLKAFKKHAADWIVFNDFINWWGLSNFKQDDFQNYITDSGHRIPSLVESIYIQLSKNLLQLPIDVDNIKEFIPKIANISKKYSNMQYPPYYYAKLLLAIGNKELFIQAFLPFAKKKRNDFWVWDLMSEIYNKDSDEYYSCLCKSLLCGAPDKFTGNVREKIADVFISKNMFAEAKCEYINIIELRKKEGWPLKEKHTGWKNFDWWQNTQENKNNIKIYSKNIDTANSILFANIVEDIAIVEYVNTDKKLFSFIVSKQKYGFISYRGLKIKPDTGDKLAIRFFDKTDTKSNFYKVATVIKTDKEPDSDIFKPVKGKITIRDGNSFGFVNNVFVPPQIISKYKLKDGCELEGAALQTYNSKRKAWGWNIINLKK